MPKFVTHQQYRQAVERTVAALKKDKRQTTGLQLFDRLYRLVSAEEESEEETGSLLPMQLAQTATSATPASLLCNQMYNCLDFHCHLAIQARHPPAEICYPNSTVYRRHEFKQVLQTLRAFNYNQNFERDSYLSLHLYQDWQLFTTIINHKITEWEKKHSRKHEFATTHLRELKTLYKEHQQTLQSMQHTIYECAVAKGSAYQRIYYQMRVSIDPQEKIFQQHAQQLKKRLWETLRHSLQEAGVSINENTELEPWRRKPGEENWKQLYEKVWEKIRERQQEMEETSDNEEQKLATQHCFRLLADLEKIRKLEFQKKWSVKTRLVCLEKIVANLEQDAMRQVSLCIAQAQDIPPVQTIPASGIRKNAMRLISPSAIPLDILNTRKFIRTTAAIQLDILRDLNRYFYRKPSITRTATKEDIINYNLIMTKRYLTFYLTDNSFFRKKNDVRITAALAILTNMQKQLERTPQVTDVLLHKILEEVEDAIKKLAEEDRVKYGWLRHIIRLFFHLRLLNTLLAIRLHLQQAVNSISRDETNDETESYDAITNPANGLLDTDSDDDSSDTKDFTTDTEEDFSQQHRYRR